MSTYNIFHVHLYSSWEQGAPQLSLPAPIPSSESTIPHEEFYVEELEGCPISLLSPASIHSYRTATPLVETASDSFSPSSSVFGGRSLETLDTPVPAREQSPYRLFTGSEPSQSKEFWFDDVTVVIKVENTLYRLYKGVLVRQSDYMRKKLETPPPPPPSRAKSKYKTKQSSIRTVLEHFSPGTINNPLVLEVVKSDFEILLSYMFPQDYAAQYEFALKEWTAIVSVATKLELNSIRAVAINKIQAMSSPIDLVELGRKHTISQLYKEGFRLLCHREESLSLQEGEKLGLASVIQIAHARDLLAKGSLWSYLEFSTEFTLVD